MTRHFSQFLYSPYGEGEGLRAVDAAPEGVGPTAAIAPGAAGGPGLPDPWAPPGVVEWPLTHRPFDDDGPDVSVAGHSPGDEAEAEARAEAEAHAARAALLAQVYGWPRRSL